MWNRTLNFAYYIFNHIKNHHIRRFLVIIVRGLSQVVHPAQIQNGFINSSFSTEDTRKNRDILDEWEKEDKKSIKSITWFIPSFDSPHAGISNILSFIKFFLSKGIDINVVLLGSAIETSHCLHMIKKNREFDFLEKCKILANPEISKLPYTDAGIATRCDTAYSLLKFNNTNSKFYFIQDDERLLYTDKVQIGLAEQTYHFGFIGITNAECLKEMYVKEFGGKAESYFQPPNIEPVEGSNKQIRRVFFYSRPEPGNSRNGFILGLDGLKEIRKRHPEVEFVAAGSEIKFNDHGLNIKELGKVPLSQLPEFYSSCNVGIYILLSRHTGVIPFELMASGCAVLTNRRSYEQSYLRHMGNCILFDLTPASIADAFDILYGNKEIYQKIIANGLKFIKEMPTLEEEIGRMYKFMVAKR
ncbi:MAG TPA: glycosyltransferase [Dehalococcoidia bacterium]|nr:glycosyltransferase [Dehalococcoidia bacterium]